jgi:hypothetical protein
MKIGTPINTLFLLHGELGGYFASMDGVLKILGNEIVCRAEDRRGADAEGGNQLMRELERLQAEGRMPSLSKLFDVITQVRAEKILEDRKGKRGGAHNEGNGAMKLTELLGREPCKRRSGSFRAYFATKEEAKAFAANPAEPAPMTSPARFATWTWLLLRSSPRFFFDSRSSITV